MEEQAGEPSIEQKGYSREGDVLQVAGDYAETRIEIAYEPEFAFGEPVFFDVPLKGKPDAYTHFPKGCVETLKEHSILVVGGLPDIDTAHIAREFALRTAGPAFRESLGLREPPKGYEWNPKHDPRRAATEIMQCEKPGLFIFSNVRTDDLKG
ncbi:MAG: hypothetical protein AAGA95_18490, partial [Pseudomonadota bacterium]